MAVPQIGSISMACTNISPSPTKTMAGGGDRLSTLGDDLLRRILHFVPTKEAASTSVLSRRWRSLWRSSGAVNLAVCVHEDERDHSERTFFSRRDAFVHAAKAALTAADARVTRLTFRVAADDNNVIYRFLHGSRDWRTEHDVVGGVLSHPAARSVEELRVAAGSNLSGFFPDSEDYVVDSHSHRDIGIYDRASLPSSERLRVLDLTGCRNLAPAAATAAFPRLATLRLRLCCVQSGDLQALVDAAPGLATVQLESVLFKRPTRRAGTAADDFPGAVRLRFPAATALALELCGMEGEQRWSGDNGAIEIDAPRLRSFTYKGSLRQFRLRSPAPDIASVDVHFVRGVYERHHGSSHSTRVLFWQFVHNFADARALRLKVNYLKDIAAVGKPNRKELLFVFPNAMRLELEGVHDPSSKTAAVAVANLLRCCPVLCDLKLKLSTVPSDSDKDSNYGRAILEQKDRLDYNRSVDRFMRRTRLNPMISLDDGNDDYHKVSDIPGLSGHCFACLQSSLTRVGLQFRLDSNSNCFGVRLVKFFAHHGKVLKEMCVDSGNRKLCEHMNLDVERWVAPNAIKACLKRKNPTECLWEFSKVPKKSHDSATNSRRRTEGFTVLPLQR